MSDTAFLVDDDVSHLIAGWQRDLGAVRPVGLAREVKRVDPEDPIPGGLRLGGNRDQVTPQDLVK